MDRVRERHLLNQQIRTFFETRDFLEVETPYLVPAPGTDPYIEPIRTEVRYLTGATFRYLHTSPEFAMKRLVSEGYERIYQLCRTFRDAEDTERHSPEFTMLEWYRSGADVSEIIDDVESLCREVLPDQTTVANRRVTLTGPWTQISMHDLIDSICGFDILNAQTDQTLRDALDQSVGLNPRASSDWDEMFFDMWVRFIDPVLEKMGAVFIVDWPTRLAVLAERDPDDPRLSKRFELFVGGLEIANGFQELTDATEQRVRFEEDNRTRRINGLTVMPMPEGLLEVLTSGMPRSAGVALGVDRLLMLKTGTHNISDVLNQA